ncbi:MAG: hypothetical protein DRP73_04515 [Candidatus Omnitrophota bacterium]|nr:MAG: hypothetical protein DRP73_04515 [Candidatus Omnitrophota bacterium]
MPSIFSGSAGDGLQGFEMPSTDVLVGFPIPVSGEIHSTPVLADIDADGAMDLVTYGGDGKIWVFDLNNTYEIDSFHLQWPTHRHDIWRTGCYSTPQIGLSVKEKRPIVSSEKRSFRLYPLSPNPFSRMLQIRFSLPEKTGLTLKVFDVSGRAIKVLENGTLLPGIYTLYWDGRDDRGNLLPDGLYFVTLKVKGKYFNRKVVLLKK